MTVITRRRALAVALLAATSAACSTPSGAPSSNAGGGDSEAAQGGGDPVALDFSATTTEGTSFEATSLQGSPVALWFWAPWCTICRAEGPEVAEVAAEFAGRVTTIGVPGRGEVEAMRSFIADTGTSALQHVVDPDGSLWTRFGVVSQPSFVFLDSAGAATTFAGSLGADGLRSALQAVAA